MAVFVPLRDDEDRDPPPPGPVDELFDRPLSAEEVTQTILRIEGEALEVAEPVEPEAADFALEPPRRFGFVMGRFRRTGMRLRLAAERVDTPVDLREIADQHRVPTILGGHRAQDAGQVVPRAQDGGQNLRPGPDQHRKLEVAEYVARGWRPFDHGRFRHRLAARRSADTRRRGRQW